MEYKILRRWSWVVIISLSIAIYGCVSAPSEPYYQPSGSSLPVGQSSFAEYVEQTHQWLLHNRQFMTDNRMLEVQANSPFEMLPPTSAMSSTRKGILLVHGLADSPYSFVDIAPVLTNMGFVVRTILLQGHGSRPADLINADADDWRDLVAHHVALFKQDVDTLYLGGFSTGANLVSSYAMGDDDIAGLMLFSPGFKAGIGVDKFAPMVPMFTDWLYAPRLEGETNYVRYMVTPSNGFAQFYDTSAEVMFRFKQGRYNKPVFIALSQADSVIDVNRVLSLFSKRISNPNSRLLWFGERPETNDTRVKVFAAKVPQYHISNFSHMGILFRPDNPYYGFQGSERICDNGQSDNRLYRQCLDGGEIWYSAWGHVEKGKHHARLTFNPYFTQMVTELKKVLDEQSLVFVP